MLGQVRGRCLLFCDASNALSRLCESRLSLDFGGLVVWWFGGSEKAMCGGLMCGGLYF
jgi:hypothetical protein